MESDTFDFLISHTLLQAVPFYPVAGQHDNACNSITIPIAAIGAALAGVMEQPLKRFRASLM